MPTLKGRSQFKSLRINLRQNMAAPELKLWSRLKSNQFYSLKFRRQHGIGNYIVDFFCPQLRIAIEVDGESHYNGVQVKTDKDRSSFLNSLGIQIFRYTNTDIMENIDGVLMDIAGRLKIEGSTSPGPSLQRRGDNL